MIRASLNRALDALPRTRFGLTGRQVPAFRACGVAGFHVAVAGTLAGGLLAGRSLLVLAVLCAVCALSFFAYALARRWLTGHERLVALEHVWIAVACAAGTAWLLDEPVLPYLDPLSVGLALFLAGGRIGCLLVGCCHGRPAAFGIRYGEHGGFPGPWVGVRLFPVQALEALLLLAIALTALVCLPFARAGTALVWVAAAYALTRFGLEGLRGDARRRLLGLSQAHWMALAELGMALLLAERVRGAPLDARAAALLAGLVAGLAGTVTLGHARDRRRRLLAPAHVAGLRTLVRECDAGPEPVTRQTGAGAVVVLSAPFTSARLVHVSLSIQGELPDLELLCELAARAFPELWLEAAQPGAGAVLHLAVPTPLPAAPAEPTHPLAGELYGRVARELQSREEVAPTAEEGQPDPAFTPAGNGRQAYFQGPARAAGRAQSSP